MVDMGAVHAFTAEMHTGFLILAFACIACTFLCQLKLRFIKGERSNRLLKAARSYLEPTGFVAAIAGVFGLVLSAITGSLSWPAEMIQEDPLTGNKIILTSCALAIWCAAVFFRWKSTRDLWTFPSSSLLYTGMAAAAFGLTALAGSLGAHIVQGGSLLDPVLGALGLDLTQKIILDSSLAYIVIIASIAVIAGFVLAAWKTGISKRQMRVSKAGGWPSWKE